MRYLEFLREVHAALAPPTYLEIGIRRGDSFALCRSSAIGIDPAYKLNVEPPEGSALFRETSDDYFSRERPLEPFGGRPISLAFIDGMHLAEFALRDFINVEQNAAWTSVVVFDDVLPRRQIEAARDRSTRAWTGDIFKIARILRRDRPDLICLHVGTSPTGLLLVLGLDPDDRVLSKGYDEIAQDIVVPDPQRVPSSVLKRRDVLDPADALAASFWRELREARDAGLSRDEGLRRVRAAIRRDFGRRVPGPLRRVLPTAV